MNAHGLSLQPLAGEEQAQVCARMMAGMDPWVRLGRDYAACLRLVTNPAKEVMVATSDEGVEGFIVLDMNGSFVGYIQILCVRPAAQRRGLGQLLIEWAEERIHRVSPNVYICVSSFNTRARALYERVGFEYVGTLKDLIVKGYDEILLRKTIGPISTFMPPPAASPAGPATPGA
jgi:ribosomal protein S18 acetylase RimI-like enzyme